MYRSAILLALGAQFLSAQATGGLRGVVADPTGAVLPGIKIQVRNTSTDVTSDATSLRDGTFRLHGLATGAYQLTIVPPSGLRSFQAKGIIVSGGAIRDLGRLRLALGQVTSEIWVAAAPPPLEITPAETTSRRLETPGGLPSVGMPLCDLFPDTVMVRDGRGWHVIFPGMKQPGPVAEQAAPPQMQL
jgi:hypothetical protein